MPNNKEQYFRSVERQPGGSGGASFRPALGSGGIGRLSLELEASLSYRSSPRTAEAMQRNTVLEKEQRSSKKATLTGLNTCLYFFQTRELVLHYIKIKKFKFCNLKIFT